jgi:hypothetical protein
MPGTTKKRFAGMLIYLLVIQTALPLIVGLIMLSVRAQQRQAMAKSATNKAAQFTMRIKLNDAHADFLGKDELLFNGKMYEVDALFIQDSEYVLTVRLDKKESEIWGHNSSSDFSSLNTIIHHIRSLPFYLLYFEHGQRFDLFSQFIGYTFNIAPVCAFNTHKLKTPHPPPRSEQIFAHTQLNFLDAIEAFSLHSFLQKLQKQNNEKHTFNFSVFIRYPAYFIV